VQFKVLPMVAKRYHWQDIGANSDQ